MNFLKKYLIFPFFGTLSAILCTSNLLICVIPITLICSIAYFIPFKTLKQYVMNFIMPIPTAFYMVSYWLLRINIAIDWDIQKPPSVNKKNWYLITCNHLSWLDICAVAGSLSPITSPIKFFLKKDLLWTLPFVGIPCKLLGFPLLERRGKRTKKGYADINSTRKACELVMKYPTSLFMFTEGTRCTPPKQRKQKSPYNYLLKPKAGGTALTLTIMKKQLAGMINVTVNYAPRQFTLLDFMLGRLRKVNLRFDLIPIDEVPIGDYYTNNSDKKHFLEWLNALWSQKDQQLKDIIDHDTL